MATVAELCESIVGAAIEIKRNDLLEEEIKQLADIDANLWELVEILEETS